MRPMQWMHDIRPSIAVCCTTLPTHGHVSGVKITRSGQSYCLSEILSVKSISDKSRLIYPRCSKWSGWQRRSLSHPAGHCRRCPHACCDRFRHTSRILATLPVFCTAPASSLVSLPALVMTRILLSCRHNNCLLQNPAHGSSGTTAG